MLYSEQNDEILVNLTLVGNQKAYEELVLRYQSAVLASAYSVMHNSYMAEDAAQDAFVSAWLKLNTLREPAKFGAWVCRIAKNSARNMVVRVREYMDFDVLLKYEQDHNACVEGLLMPDENYENLHDSIARLPDKVKQVLCLHYFEGLSIAEIAEQMHVPAGTVKWQLHEGRQKIRKDLCAMNEQENDTLVEKVMKKVEELKLMLLNNDRSPIENAYRALLPEIENLHESTEKYSALANILQIGWWNVKGTQSDETFARLRDAAERSHNDEVMEAVTEIEHSKLSGDALLEFIRDQQIPRLEQGNYPLSLGCAWFWLANEYFRRNDWENGQAALEQVLALLKPKDVYYANAISVKKALLKRRELAAYQYNIQMYAEHYRIVNGELRAVSQPGYGLGKCELGKYHDPMYIFWNLAACDRYFPPHGQKLGETYTGTDGTSSLTLEADALTLETPCGTFPGCELWVTRTRQGQIVKTYLKSGVGIVKQEVLQSGETTVTLLKEYHVEGGEGLLPCAAGNRWDYVFEGLPSNPCVDCGISAEMIYADGTNVTVAHNNHFIREKYNENDWEDMILQMRREYCSEGADGNEHLADVSYPMERAKALAKTSRQRAHTRAACSVMQRILDTDSEFNPNRTMSGHWNFFEYLPMIETDGGRTLDDNGSYGFEWKEMAGTGDAGYPLLFNDIYTILTDAAGCLWSDEWKPGAALEIRRLYWKTPITTKLTCDSAGTIVTAAGSFGDCRKLTLDIEGFSGGLAYRGGHKEYYFAPTVGIVRVVSSYPNGERTATYDLTSYTGRSAGYMPLFDTMTRRYDAVDLTDGYIGWAEYTVSGDVIFADRCGVKKL
ncbi:MAG: RNA polymerase sigma factor [Eubacteriales bacterium]